MSQGQIGKGNMTQGSEWRLILLFTLPLMAGHFLQQLYNAVDGMVVGNFAANGESALAAPIIASYCMASVLWSRLFLKEKLSWKHYLSIAVIVAGIIIMGVFDM